MSNKYLFLIQKDELLRVVSVLAIIGVIACLILFRLCVAQNNAYQDIQEKQVLIGKIPALEAKIVIPKVFVKGLSLTFNGVILGKGQPLAVINDTFVKIGGQIDGQMLTLVTGKSATLCDVKSANKCIKLLLQ